MARSRRNRKPGWSAVPMWIVMTGIAGWGLWQLAQFRHTLLAEAQSAPAAPVETAPTSGDTTALGATDTTLSLTTQPADTDPWHDALAADPAADTNDQQPATAPAATIEIDRNEEIDELTTKGMTLLDAGRVIEGRTALNSALALLDDAPDSDDRPRKLRATLADINDVIFLGSAILPEDAAAKYVDIHRGDSFLKIGKRYGLTADFLETLNPSLNPRNLKPTTGVKIIEGPFHLKLVKHAKRADLYVRDWYVRSYNVEFDDGNYLPRGTYRVRSGAKIHLDTKFWMGFEGADSTTRDITAGWMYASAGTRAGNPRDDRPTGIKFADNDLAQLYNVLVESRSLLHVEP